MKLSLNSDVIRKQRPLVKKETSRSITYRLPSNVVEELEIEAKNKKISHNVLVKQVLEKYLVWDRYSDKLGIIPVPKKILEVMGQNLDRSEEHRLNSSHPSRSRMPSSA